jgi:hypothetical protein
MCKVKMLRDRESYVMVNLKDGTLLRSSGMTKSVSREKGVKSQPALKDFLLNEVKETFGVENEDISYTCMVPDNMDMDCIYISDHAADRLKERNGWSEKTSLRMLKRVFDNGTKEGNLKGAVRHWLDAKHDDGNMSSFIVYGNVLYVFHDNVLVTAYTVPTKTRLRDMIGKRDGENTQRDRKRNKTTLHDRRAKTKRERSFEY